eukprot:UN02381
MSSSTPLVSQQILTKTSGVGITHPHNTSKSKKKCIFLEITNFMGIMHNSLLHAFIQWIIKTKRIFETSTYHCCCWWTINFSPPRY